MNYFTPIEDPRHTPGKRHGYAKELSSSSSQALPNNNQKSLFTNFITTPPVAKPQSYFSTNGFVGGATKLYHVKSERDNNNTPVLYPSEKSAFTKYQNSMVEQSLMPTDPPVIGDRLIPDNGILRPEPRYATPVIDSSSNSNSSTIAFRSAQYAANNDGGLTQIMGVDIIPAQNGTSQQAVQMAYSDSGYRGSPPSPSPPPKRLENQPRMKNFKDILNTFQMASDRALRQQQERFRYSTSGYESDQGFYTQNSGRSSEVAYSEQDYRLKKNKQQHHPRALTISIPAVGKSFRPGLPEQWSMEVNGTYVDVDSPSPPSSTMSAISSTPPSPPLTSPHPPPSGTNRSVLPTDYRQLKQRAFGENSLERGGPVRQRRYARSASRSRPVSDIEPQTRRAGPPSSSHSYVIRCLSMGNANKLRIASSRTSSLSPPLPPPEPNSSETEDDDSASVVGLYKQMTGNHLELLEYASTHLGKFFRNRDLMVSKTSLNKLKLNDLIFESLAPAFSKSSTYFFDAFLPHDGFLSSAISLMAEPAPRQYASPVKFSFSDGNIWNPPTLVEIKSQRDEEQQILRSCTPHRISQKYRFLVIPRYNFLALSSLAVNSSQALLLPDYFLSDLHQDVWNVQILNEVNGRQSCFILLQLVCALKSLQLNGIETLSSDFSEFILLYKYARTLPDAGDIDHLPRLLLLQESLKTRNKKPAIGLCDYGLRVLSTMFSLNNRDSLTNFTFPAETSYSCSLMECARALQQDKSSSLTDAKNALQFGMFVGQDASQLKSEEDAQAWIDSQRAHYVNYLFREVIDGSCKLNEVYEQLRLQFLLSTTPRILLQSIENMHS